MSLSLSSSHRRLHSPVGAQEGKAPRMGQAFVYDDTPLYAQKGVSSLIGAGGFLILAGASELAQRFHIHLGRRWLSRALEISLKER